MTDDLLQRTVRELRDRIAEMEALTAELPRLKAALAALEGDAGRVGRKRSGASTSSRRRRRRRPRGANRAAILVVVRSRPGVTVGEVANAVAEEGVSKPTAYTTVSKLVRDGELVKRGEGLQASQTASP